MTAPIVHFDYLGDLRQEIVDTPAVIRDGDDEHKLCGCVVRPNIEHVLLCSAHFHAHANGRS